MSESLFKISTDLARLVNQRADLIEALTVACTANDQVSIGRAIEAIEAQIRDHAKPNEVVKVDQFRAYYLHQKMLRDASKQEKQRQAANEKNAQDVMDFMERIGKTTLEELGKDRLEGRLGHIRLQTNGGSEPPPLISQPDLVPDSMCSFTGTLHWALFVGMIEELRESRWKRQDVDELREAFTRVPSPALIKAELESDCDYCGGKGFTEGSQHDAHTLGMGGRCERCGGSGKGSVPGCSLQSRGQHVRIS